MSVVEKEDGEDFNEKLLVPVLIVSAPGIIAVAIVVADIVEQT